MNILKLNAEVLGGGANQIATALLDSYFENGHQVMMGVRGIPKTVKENRFIFEIPNEEQRNTIYRIAKKLLVNS